MLNQEQLEGLKALYESHLEGWSFISKLNVTLSNYVRELGMNDEAKPIIDFSDLLVDTKNMNELAKDHWGNKVVKKKPYTFDFEQISEAALAILDRLNWQVKRFFRARLRLVMKNHLPFLKRLRIERYRIAVYTPNGIMRRMF